MKVREAVEKLGLKVKTAASALDQEITSGYASDLLSDVMANTREGVIWVTLQTHQNIVAVASLKELSGIVIVNQRQPEQETVQKAEAEGVPLLLTDMPAFEVIGKLYQLGITGR